MKNMMKEYLENEYSDNHLRNFCLYFDGDLRADTLMSAWTPIKWVVDFLNENKGIRFRKYRRNSNDPLSDLRILSEDGNQYLPKNHKLVWLLYDFLELAEQKCNFILLPDRKMNCARYKTYVNGEKIWLYDEVPATLSHVFDKNSLGRYFLGSDNEVELLHVYSWIAREHLEMGFLNEEIAPENVRPLIPELNPYEAKWLRDGTEIGMALEYMIEFLQKRKLILQSAE